MNFGWLQNIWGWLEFPSLVQVQCRWGEELISYLSLFEYYHRKEQGGEGGYHYETHSPPPPYPYIEIFHQLPTHFLCFLLLFQETGIKITDHSLKNQFHRFHPKKNFLDEDTKNLSDVHIKRSI